VQGNFYFDFSIGRRGEVRDVMVNVVLPAMVEHLLPNMVRRLVVFPFPACLTICAIPSVGLRLAKLVLYYLQTVSRFEGESNSRITPNKNALLNGARSCFQFGFYALRITDDSTAKTFLNHERHEKHERNSNTF
jgi:hypothetical protein